MAKSKRAPRAQSDAPNIDEERNKDQKAGDSATDPAAEGNGGKSKIDSNDDVAKQGDQPNEAPDLESKDDEKVKQDVGDAASRPDPAGSKDEVAAAKETPEQRDGEGDGLLNDGRASLPQGSISPKADKALQEVRRVRAEAEDRLKYKGRTETEASIVGIKDPDDNPNDGTDAQAGPVLSINTVGGRVYVQIDDGPEVVLDQNGAADAKRKLAIAFQAVS